MFKNGAGAKEKPSNSGFSSVALRSAFVLLVLLILSASVFSARLIDPLSKELIVTPSDGSSSPANFVGTVALGNTIELIFSKELTNKYDSLSVTSINPDFNYSLKNEREAIKLFISVPKDAVVGDYPVLIVLSGEGVSDKVDLYFSVVQGVLNVSPSEVDKQDVEVGGSAEYKLFFVNNSDSDAIFTVTTDLPGNWMQSNPFSITPVSKTITVPKQQKIDEFVTVYPRLEGTRDFKVIVAYENTSKEFSFSVNARPTLESKLSSAQFGFPFFSFSLLPSYFFNALASLFLK